MGNCPVTRCRPPALPPPATGAAAAAREQPMGCCRALGPTGFSQHQRQVLSYLALGSPTSARPPVPACAGAPFTQPVLPLCNVPSSSANPFPHCPSGSRLHRPDSPLSPPFLCSNRTSSRGWAHLIVRVGVAMRPPLRSGQPGRTLASGTPRLGLR